MRLRFEEQLNELNRDMISTAALCEEAITQATDALADGSAAEAKGVADITAQISRKEREIEDMCLKLLMQQQPVASDLRIISAALKMVSDLERIGDQSDDIAEIVGMQTVTAADDKMEMLDMAKAAADMVTEAINAFVRRDADKARQVIDMDDTVDDYFDKIKTEIAKSFSSKNADIAKALDLLMISKYFERIGDHAVNIAQWVIFMVTGVLEGNTK